MKGYELATRLPVAAPNQDTVGSPTAPASQGPRAKAPKSDHESVSKEIGTSALATAPSDEHPTSLRYRLKRESRHCWAICELKRRKRGDRYEPFQWYPRLEQACDRLAELYLHEDVSWELLNVADLRRAVTELKENLTKEMLDRMLIP